MRFNDMYPGTVSQADTSTQQVSQPASADRSTSAQSQPPPPPVAAHTAVAISWVGIVIALVLLRVVFEVAE